MPTITKTFTFSPNTLIKATEVNAVLDQVFNLVNGLLDDANIATLAESKIDFTATGGHDHSGGVQGALIAMPLAQCRLGYVSTTSIRLDPFNGNRLYIPGSGTTFVIPAAGVTVTNAAIGNNALRYVFVRDVAGTLTLDFDSVAPVIDTASGLFIKAGPDATRLLVGMIRTGATGLFADSPAQRFVRSYFNRPPVGGLNYLAANATITSLTYVEADAAARVEFLSWADEIALVGAAGTYSGLASDAGVISLGLDGAASVLDIGVTAQLGSSSSQSIPWSTGGTPVPGQGYHFLTIIAKKLSGTSLIIRTTNSAGERTGIWVSL